MNKASIDCELNHFLVCCFAYLIFDESVFHLSLYNQLKNTTILFFYFRNGVYKDKYF